MVPSQISVVLIPYGKRRFAMTRPLALRDDFDGDLLRQMACGSKHGAQVRRLLSLAAIYDGASRSEAAHLGGVTVQIIRDWVVRFNARGADGLFGRQGAGQQTQTQRCAAVGPGRACGARPDPSRPRRRALALQRPRPVDLRDVPHLARRDDRQSRDEGHGLCQAQRPPAPSPAERVRHRGF